MSAERWRAEPGYIGPAEFVGGPLDGRVEAVRLDAHVIQYPQRKALPPIVAAPTPSIEKPEVVLHEYRLERTLTESCYPRLQYCGARKR